MRWFKHRTDASDDEFIASLECALGLEAYARWWKLLEAIGKQMDKTGKCSASYPILKWMNILSCRYEKTLTEFLIFCMSKGKLDVSSTLARRGDEAGNFIREIFTKKGELIVSCPKLLEYRDEYSKKSGQTPDKLRTNSGLSRASASASVSIGKKDTIQEERMFSKKEGKFTVGSVS